MNDEGNYITKEYIRIRNEISTKSRKKRETRDKWRKERKEIIGWFFAYYNNLEFLSGNNTGNQATLPQFSKMKDG